MPTVRTAFRVHGTVQGVGFRAFTKKCAIENNLSGWARNTTCDKVEGEVQGSDDKVQLFFQQIGNGPGLAHVTKLEKQEKDLGDGGDFALKRTTDSTFKSST